MGRSIQVRPIRDEERQGLRTLQRSGSSIREFTRARAVAAVAGGLSTAITAEALGITQQSVRDAIHRFNADGVDGLREGSRSGRPRVLNDRGVRAVLRAIDDGPAAHGVPFYRWTLTLLVMWVCHVVRVQISEAHLSRILAREGYVWRRPKHTLDHFHDRDEQAAARARLAQLQAEAIQQPRAVHLIYTDESDIHLNPVIR